jgi:hypothetical protein
MEATGSSETSVNTSNVIWCINTEGQHLNSDLVSVLEVRWDKDENEPAGFVRTVMKLLVPQKVENILIN